MSKINFNSYFINAQGSDGALVVGEFKSWISIAYLLNKQQALRIPINRETHLAIRKGLEAIKTASNGTRIVATIRRKWDKDARKFAFESHVVLGKNEEGEYYIELKGQDTAPVQFPFRWPGAVVMGSDEPDKVTKSAHALEAFTVYWNEELPQTMVLSRMNWEDPRNQNRGGGGGNPDGGAVY